MQCTWISLRFAQKNQKFYTYGFYNVFITQKNGSCGQTQQFCLYNIIKLIYMKSCLNFGLNSFSTNQYFKCELLYILIYILGYLRFTYITIK